LKTILVDTDILIEVLRERDPQVLNKWRAIIHSDALILYSPVSAAEIFHGIREGEREVVEASLGAMICVPVDEKIGRRAGEYLRLFHGSHNLKLGDALIAATAAIHELELWTRNRKHYPMKDVRHYG